MTIRRSTSRLRSLQILPPLLMVAGFRLASSVLPQQTAPKLQTGSEAVVRWSTRLTPADVRAGQRAWIEMHAEMRPGWFIRPLAGDWGPTPCYEIRHYPLTIDGRPGAPPDSAGYGADVGAHGGWATFRLPVRVRPGPLGDSIARVVMHYQPCSDEISLPPRTEEVPVAFRVLPRDGTRHTGYSRECDRQRKGSDDRTRQPDGSGASVLGVGWGR